MIAGTDGDWKGSGRSIASFDLHGGLGACSELLERWGGHRAAAGLSIKPENVEAFAEAFAEHAAGLLVEEDVQPVTRIDAVVPRGTQLTLDLCAELGRLAPFGLGNPEVTLLAPGCELGELATVGEGKHLRFRVRRDGFDAGGAIAFGAGTRLDSYRSDGRWHVAFRLEENRWNGTIAPQLVVRRIFAAETRFEELRDWLVGEYRKPADSRDGEATVQELTDTIGSTQQNVSKHLGVLRRSGVIARRKRGNFAHYRIEDEAVFALCEVVCGSLQRQASSLRQLVANASD